MHGLYEVKRLLLEELESHADDDKLTGESLQEIDMLAHATKNLCKVIECCDEEEYSERSYGRYSGRRRDSMGRYTRDSGYSERMSNGYERPAHSYGGNRDNVVEQLEQMMATAADDRTRGKFRELIRDMRNS